MKCEHSLAKRPILYTDTINGTQVQRDDMWAVTTEELNNLHALLAPVSDAEEREAASILDSHNLCEADCDYSCHEEAMVILRALRKSRAKLAEVGAALDPAYSGGDVVWLAKNYVKNVSEIAAKLAALEAIVKGQNGAALLLVDLKKSQAEIIAAMNNLRSEKAALEIELSAANGTLEMGRGHLAAVEKEREELRLNMEHRYEIVEHERDVLESKLAALEADLGRARGAAITEIRGFLLGLADASDGEKAKALIFASDTLATLPAPAPVAVIEVAPSGIADLPACSPSASESAPAPVAPRNYPCGCVSCRCDNDEKCQGCGAKNCGNHPGIFPVAPKQCECLGCQANNREGPHPSAPTEGKP